MKLLILTQYFPPETGAPQNRLFELAIRLKAKGVDVEILTAMPNYPKMEIFEAYKGKSYIEEELHGLKIYRSRIFVSKSKGIFKRLLNYFSFVVTSYWRGRKLGNYDYILCESPPLFLGYSATRLAKKLKAKLIFNVSDLWPESAEKLDLVRNRTFLKLAYNLEAKLYSKSYLVTGQTQGIVDSISTRFPNKKVYWLPNGVDIAKYNPQEVFKSGFRKKYGISETDLVLFYGGIIGHAQGLELILNAAREFTEQPVKFVLLGSGPEKDKLLSMQKELNLKNVIFAEPVGRNEMGGIIKEIDISLIPLRKLDLFLGAIPSKIFEILAMEKPILLGVDGEARDLFIDSGDAGWYFEPENVIDLTEKISHIITHTEEIKIKGMNGRNYVSKHFNRETIVNKFYNYLIDLEKAS
ncbi:MAG: glycosyltransferase family 4 protein [Putridiphycobacter sp.]|nr:glycosyltransferase family 4 protein [Putridiphycobacter sp.]